MNHLKFDLHIHSEYSSDSFVPIKKILKFSKKIGLSGIAITDHNTIKGGLEAKKLNKSDLVIIIGSEITLNNGGELLGLFLQREISLKELTPLILHLKIIKQFNMQKKIR